MTVPVRSSSPVKATARSRGGATSSAHKSDAIAPLVSQAPSPTTRPSPMRARNGSSDQPALTGTVSTCALTSRRGVPQVAST